MRHTGNIFRTSIPRWHSLFWVMPLAFALNWPIAQLCDRVLKSGDKSAAVTASTQWPFWVPSTWPAFSQYNSPARIEKEERSRAGEAPLSEVLRISPSFEHRRDCAGLRQVAFGITQVTLWAHDASPMVETSGMWSTTESRLGVPFRSILTGTASSDHRAQLPAVEATIGTWSVEIFGRRFFLRVYPIWQGCVANAICYGMVVLLGMMLINLIRRWRRRIGSRCEECGYPMGGGDTCSECGVRAGALAVE